MRRVAAWIAVAGLVATALWRAEDAGWFDAWAVPVSDETARTMLADVAQWDAATPGERRGVAERVDARLDDFTLLRVRSFGFEGHRHEIAVFAHPATGLEFSLIPGGTFVMGAPAEEAGREDDETQHEATLTRAFLLARTECTQAAYTWVTGTNLSISRGPDLPVEQVSWNDAQAFNAKLGLRLPSEAEWEYACRAGTTARFWPGEEEADLARAAWYSENLHAAPDAPDWLIRLLRRVSRPPPVLSTHPVGTRAANPFGLYDVHGNVWEWCEDGYGDYPPGPATDPTGVQAASSRVCRGGGWSGTAGGERSAYRYRYDPAARHLDLGFRPARSVPLE